MAGFYLYTSNRLEHLISVLGDQIKQPRHSIFEPQTIVVQSKGMQQWLTLQIAKYLKISAFLEFPFPNLFFNRLLGKSFDNCPEKLLFDPEQLVWIIYQLLPEMITDMAFSELRLYLDNSSPLKLYQLSAKIADLFDQYTMYRPDTIRLWENGEDSVWQAILWRKLASTQPAHRQHLGNEFIKKLPEFSENGLLPERVSFFGISALPPFFAHLTEALSRFIDINYFLLNPCAEFWDDIVSEKELRKIRHRKHTKKTAAVSDLHYDTGNSLLSSLGVYGRDFLSRLHEFECDENSIATKTASENLLSHIQNQILTLSKDEMAEIDRSDRSIQVHSCHSCMRETEVLHDSILSFFDSIPGLMPSDIVVMAPDISEYTSSIRTVFGSSPDYRLPFSISDQSIKNNAPLAQGFLAILDIVNSRFTSVDIVNILENESLKKTFGISGEEMPIIADWIRRTQIRWAADPSDKARLGLPATIENSWEAGVEQLLCGFALPPQSGSLFDGIPGSDLVENSSDAILLGKFLDFFNMLKNFNVMCLKSYTLQDWAVLLQKTIKGFFKPDEAVAAEFNALNEIIARLSEDGRQAGFSDPIPFEVIKSYLNEKLESTRLTKGFLSGSITFCSLLPMRGIPFKIICLLGMNEGVFPRQCHHLSWDIISESPRRGDRMTETEDRYIFLETLLSARSIFYVSYLGQSIKNDSLMHPSVCVEELLDYINARFTFKFNSLHDTENTPAEPQSPAMTLTFRHRLHAFNPAYFKAGEQTFSYRRQSLEGALKLIGNKSVTAAFHQEKLAEPPPELCNITINDLTAFFRNPCRYLLNRRLNIVFQGFDEEMKTVEAFDIAGLEKYSLSEMVLTDCLVNQSIENGFFNYYKSLNLLPHGKFGNVMFGDLLSDVKDFSEKISNYLKNNMLENLDVSFHDFEGVTLSGELSSIYPDSQFLFRQASMKPADYIEVWLRHLLLNCNKSGTYPCRTTFVSRDSTVVFNPVSNPQEILKTLLGQYIEGCKEPLQFFQYSSFQYAEQLHVKKKNPSDALQQVYKSWYYGNDYQFCDDSSDPYIKCAFSGSDPLGSNFERISDIFYKPLFLNILQDSSGEAKDAL